MLRRKGFSYGEALISIAILAIIAVSAVWSLRSNRMKDELKTAQRVVAADIRATQSRALAAENHNFCRQGTNWICCDNSLAGCAASCDPAPPAAVGVHFEENQRTYSLYVKHDDLGDYRLGTGEVFQTRDLALSGAPNVVVWSVATSTPLPSADIAFMRQNAQIKLNACPSCGYTNSLTITLKHIISGETRTVSINALGGRISSD